MSSKNKAQYAKNNEWGKHMCKWWKRYFWSKERQKSKIVIKQQINTNN